VVALVGVLGQGCGKDEATPVDPNTSVDPNTPNVSPDAAMGATVDLCVGCGQVKGGDLCCKEGAEKCATCDLAKGSPGCCK